MILKRYFIQFVHWDMPKKSSGPAASVEGGLTFSILLGFIQDTSDDEKSSLHLSTLPENLETIYILISCE